MIFKILSPTNTPLIGSGKISRRVVITQYKKFHFRNKSNLKSSFIKAANNTSKRTYPLIFPNEKVKIVFLHWNRIGFPFINHRTIKSKTNSRAFSLIGKAINKHGMNKVISAIDKVHYLFNSPEFKYRLYFGKVKISLPNFFQYDQNTYHKVSTFVKDCPRSWFNEAIRKKDLSKKYAVLLKDKHVNITNELSAIWGAYDGPMQNANTKNNLIRASKKLVKFCKANNYDKLHALELIDKMLNDFKNFKPKHAGYLANDIFWNEQFPKELLRYGTIENIEDIVEI